MHADWDEARSNVINYDERFGITLKSNENTDIVLLGHRRTAGKRQPRKGIVHQDKEEIMIGVCVSAEKGYGRTQGLCRR